MNWNYVKRDCVKMKIVQKQIHYLSSSTGFKIAISKSYQFIFTYILFHFFVTFKLRIVFFTPHRICDKRWKLCIFSWALKAKTSCQNVMVIEQWTIIIWHSQAGLRNSGGYTMGWPISWEWFYLTRMLHQNGFHPIFWCFFLFFCKLTLRSFFI